MEIIASEISETASRNNRVRFVNFTGQCVSTCCHRFNSYYIWFDNSFDRHKTLDHCISYILDTSKIASSHLFSIALIRTLLTNADLKKIQQNNCQLLETFGIVINCVQNFCRRLSWQDSPKNDCQAKNFCSYQMVAKA